MSQVRKLQQGGSWGTFTKDGHIFDLNDEKVRNEVMRRLQATANEYGDYYEQLLAPLRAGNSSSGDSIANRLDTVQGFANNTDRENRKLNSYEKNRQKRRDARTNNGVHRGKQAIANFLAAFQIPNEETKSENGDLQTINNELRVFDYDPENGGFLKNGENDSIANAAIKNRLRYYYDYLSDNDTWNKAYKWSNPLDSKVDSDLKAWYETLGADPTSRRAQLEAVVNQALDTASKASNWGEVDENTKKILSYFNIGVPVGTPEENEAAASKKTKKAWKDAGWNEALYDQYGDIFELGNDGSLKVKSGQTFNLGDWHNGRNIYFNDDFYNSDFAKTGAFDPLKGLTYYNGRLYQISDPNLARILNSENGYNAMLKAGNWTGADNEIMTRFTNGARENPGILAADKYSSFLSSNPNYRFQNLTGLQTLTNRALKPGEQIIQYVDLSNPDSISGSPYLDYTYKYRLLDENGDDLGEIDPNTLQDVINGQVQDFNAYTKIVGTDDSPYEGMYYRDYKDRNGNEIPIRIYRDSNDPDNVILHLPSLSAHNTTGNDLRLPTEVAKYITNNKKLLAILASDPKRLEQFQDIVSTLVQSGFRASNYFQHPLYSFIEGDLFGSEVKRLRNMGFSKEEAKGLWNVISKYNRKGGNRSNRRDQLLVTAPLSQKMGGKITYIEKLAKGGKSGGTTNTVSKDKKLDMVLRNYGNASGLGDLGTKNWTPADTADLVALGADLASAGIILADPTNVLGATTGVGASLARFKADTLRHKVNPNAGKGAGWNLALNLGMDAVSLIPVLGDVTKTAKTANVIRRSLPTILKLIAVAGMGDAAITSAKKIASGEKWTVRDLSIVANAVTSGIAMSRMGGFGRKTSTESAKQFKPEEIKIGDAKPQELDSEAIARIVENGSTKDAIETELKAIFKDVDGVTSEQISAKAESLLKTKKNIWQKIWGKDGKGFKTSKETVKGNPQDIEANGNWLHDWWHGVGTTKQGLGKHQVEGDRAAYLARLRGENLTKAETRKGTMWTREDIAEAPGTTPDAKYYKDEFGTFYRKGDVSQKPITAEEYAALEKTRKSGKLRSAINDEAGNFTGRVRVSADRPFAFDAQGKPVFTETVTYASPWQLMAPHILAPFHTRTDYTYPILPDYNPEIPTPDLTYVPYIAKKGGIIKAANGIPQLYNTDFLNKKANYTIDPITGKPKDSNQIQFTPITQNSSKVTITKDNPLGLNFDFLNKGTIQKWNPITRKFEFNLPSLNLPDYSIETKTAPTVTSLFPGNYDVTKIGTPQQTNVTGVRGATGQVTGPGGHTSDVEITDGNNRLFNPELPISIIRLAGILGGADKRWPKVTTAPQQSYLNVELARSDSPALQAQANSLREQLSNWRKATTSDNIQNNALKMQSDARVMDALRENTARQSQLEWETNLHNAQLRNSINEENNRIAYQNAQARDAKEMARNQFEAAKETEKQASIQQALYELQARLSQDQQYRSAINTKEYADKLNAGFDKYLANLSQTDWDKWNTLTPEQQYDYGDFRNYLAKVNPTVYANNRMMIEKRYKDMSDAIQLSQLRGRANFPVMFNKKGGRVNGTTRYTLEPDERIWIDNNKAAHAKIAKLNDNAIKLLLRALK